MGEAVSVGALGFVFSVDGVGVGEHGDFVAEAIEVISGPGEGGIWNGVGSGFGVGWVPPAAVDGVDEGGGGEGVRAIVEGIDSMADGDGEVLVTAEVGGGGASDFAEGVVAAGLGPGIGVEVGEEAVGGLSVNVDGAAKGGGGEDDFEVGSGPVLGPVVEEFKLAVAEEFEAFDVDGFAVVFGVVDVVRTGAHFWDGAFGAGFKFPVFDDGEGDAGVGEIGEVDVDAVFDGLWVDGIWEVPSLLALNHVDVFGSVEISTAGSGGGGGFDAFFTPEVCLADVVIVRDGDGGAVTHDVAELHAELEPAGGVLGVVVGLVAGEEENVGILRDEVLDDEGAGAGGAGGIAGEVANDDGVFIGGFAADLSFEGGLFGVAEAVGEVLGGVPIVETEVGGPAGVDDVFFGNFFPLVTVFDFEADFLDFVRFEGEELSAEFEGFVLKGVDGEADDVFAGDVEIDHGLLSFLFALAFPPVGGGAVIEAGILFAEDLLRGGHEFSVEGGDG